MKKLLIILLTITILIATLTPTVCLASVFVPQATEYKGYTLRSIKAEGSEDYVCVRFTGNFFGNSGIPVQVEVYADENINLNFDINDQDAKLTEAQAQTKSRLLQFFEQLYQFILQVDSLSNPNYDGVYSVGFGANKVTPLQSELNKYNALTTGKMEISQVTYEMFEIAQEMYQVTEGAYNPATYRLVDLWGFSSRKYQTDESTLPYDRVWQERKVILDGESFYELYYPLPEDKYIEAFRNADFIDFSKTAVGLSTSQDGTKYYVTKNVQPVTVDGQSYTQWIDFGGIAKGYVADYVREQVGNLGFTRFWVDLGRSSQSYGLNFDGNPAGILLSDPFEINSYAFGTRISNANFSNSGLDIRNYTTDGVTYSHIIDGATGRPTQTGINGVAVIAPTVDGKETSLSAAACDCLTTALTVMGRDKFVDFLNGNYAKQKQLQVVGFYQTVGGVKQILSNLDKSVVEKPDYVTLDSFGWALEKNSSGVFLYNESTQGISQNPGANYTVVIIVLAVVVGVALLFVVVYYFVKGKGKGANRIAHAKKDKFFKPADVMVYVAVALVIVILFSAFFATPTPTFNVVKVVDMQTDEVLFLYNVVRDECVTPENSGGWIISTEKKGNDIVVTLTRVVDGETQSNTLTITRQGTPKAKMTDSICGRHQDCVRTFSAMTKQGQTIVCSPNFIKIITE